jgi:hypothetical protein
MGYRQPVRSLKRAAVAEMLRRSSNNTSSRPVSRPPPTAMTAAPAIQRPNSKRQGRAPVLEVLLHGIKTLRRTADGTTQATFHAAGRCAELCVGAQLMQWWSGLRVEVLSVASVLTEFRAQWAQHVPSVLSTPTFQVLHLAVSSNRSPIHPDIEPDRS